MEEDKIQRWLTYFFTFSGALLTFGFALHIIGLAFERYSGVISNWDFLSFLGAIIGGGLTLIGVQITLRNQQKMDYLKNFPKLRRAADHVLHEAGTIMSFIGFVEFWGGLEKVLDDVEEIWKRNQRILDSAIEVNENTYIKTRDFFNQTLDTVLSGKSLLKSSNQTSEDLFNKSKTKLNEMHKSLISEIDKELERFRK